MAASATQEEDPVVHERFLKAINALSEIHANVDDSQKKKLYGLYKQAEEGDVGQPPAANDVVARRQYEARIPCKGLSVEESKKRYTQLVEQELDRISSGARTLDDFQKTIDIEDRSADEEERSEEGTEEPNSPQERSLETENPLGQYVMRKISSSVFNSERPEEDLETIFKEGMLFKQREVRSAWPQRFFILRGRELAYFRKLTQKQPTKKWIVDSTCKVQELPREFSKDMNKKKSGEFYPFAVAQRNIVPPLRLAASSKEERDSWMKKLRLASASEDKVPKSPREKSPRRQQSENGTPSSPDRNTRKEYRVADNGTIRTLSEETISLSSRTSESRRACAYAAATDDASENPGNNSFTVAESHTSKTPLEDIPAPYPPNPYTNEAENLIKKLKELAQDSQCWKFNGQKKGVDCYVGTGELSSAMGTGRVNFSRRAIRDMLADLDKKHLTDERFDKGHVVERIDSRSTVTYMRYKAVTPTTARDFCNFTHWRVMSSSEEEGGTLYFVAKSVDHPKCPSLNECVRAHLEIGGWIIRPIRGKKIAEGREAKRARGEDPGAWPTDVDLDTEGCECTYLVLSDLKGSIPGFVVKKVTSQQAMLVESLREALEKEWQGKPQKLKNLPTIHNFDREELGKSNKQVRPLKTVVDTEHEVSSPAKGVDEKSPSKQRSGAGANETKRSEAFNIPGLKEPLAFERPPHRVSIFSFLVLMIPALLIWGYSETPYYVREASVTPLRFLGLLLVTTIFSLLWFRRLWLGPSHMSIRRKFTIATWSAPQEGNIYGALSIDASEAQRYMADVRKRTGTKVTMTHLVVKALGTALRACPAINGRIVDNEYLEAGRVDISCLVNIQSGGGSGGTKLENQRKADLGNVKITDVDQKTVVDIANEVNAKAQKVRSGKDADFEKTKLTLKLLPVGLLRPLVSFVGYLGSQLGCTIPCLGVRAYPFGTACVSSMGSLGLDFGWAPFTPFANVPVLVTIGSVKDTVVARDGQPVVRPVMTISATLDHRYMDGSQAALLGNVFRQSLENPFDVMETAAPPIKG